MKKSHLILAFLVSIAIVGAIGDKVLLQPLPPPPPQSEPPLLQQPPNAQPTSPPSQPNAQSPLPKQQPNAQPTSPPSQPNAQPPLPKQQPNAQPTSPPSQPNAQSPLPKQQPNAQPPLPKQQPNAQFPSPGTQPALPSKLPNAEDLLDAASKLAIEKYQNASCEELSQMKPKSGKNSAASGSPEEISQAKAVEFLQNNPEIRKEFINRVAPSIANKMFDCNIIP